MRTFSISIQDDRHASPTAEVITVRDRAAAAELARKRLSASSHHSSVELFEDGVPLALFDEEGEIWRKGPGGRGPD
jgi:hypothetical protein